MAGFRKQEVGSRLALQVPPPYCLDGPGSPTKRYPGFPGSPVLASVLMPQAEGGKGSTLQLIGRRRHPPPLSPRTGWVTLPPSLSPFPRQHVPHAGLDSSPVHTRSPQA